MSKPVTYGPFIRGLDASTGVLTQPKGSFPRGSNLVLSKRGALRTCDGTLLVNAYNGVPTLGRGKAMCEFSFAPTGVASYYLRVMKALDKPLGAPQNLVGVLGGAGGNLLPSTTYVYAVTAIDGAGGETIASNTQNVTTSPSNKQVSLTWNYVPNAVAYNIYRAIFGGPLTLLTGGDVPVSQPSAFPATVSFNDTGDAVASQTIPIASATVIFTAPLVGQFFFSANFILNTAMTITPGYVFQYSPGSDPNFVQSWTVEAQTSQLTFQASCTNVANVLALNEQTIGGSIILNQTPPLADTTQQTALYVLFAAASGITYTNANIYALWPADPGEGNRPNLDGGTGGGGGGGHGGGGGGGGGQQGSTPSGGIVGNVTFIPQIVQFTNQAVIALGNGFPVQVWSDSTGSQTNPATFANITSISSDAFGVVTINLATPHNINQTQGVGSNVYVYNNANPAYNTGAAVVIAIPSTTSLKVRNLAAAGQAPSSGGQIQVTTVPLISNFVPAYPTWVTAVAYSVNSIITPTVSNGHYYKAIQGGTSGGSQPTFPTGTGARVADGSVIWQEAGLLNSAAPPPPAGAHIQVYAGSLWVYNTFATTTSTGLDGPTSLRMSDVNNLNSWNPINQAFLDKDDGMEGLGLATFTIAAQGIPPEGSLCAFKKRTLYQIVGVFGSSNFAIQRAQTNVGTIAPRTILFVPGFGLMRLTHLGFAIFDGVNDRVVSTQIEPYLYGSNDPELADIITMDQQWMAISQAALTAMPPMYCCAIPIGGQNPGSSNGALTRIMCFDLVLKAWTAPIDLPFPISTMAYVTTTSTIVVTLMGSFSDGTLQRWQAGDDTWATAVAGSNLTAPIVWDVRPPTLASKDADERLYCRRITVVGQQTGAAPSSLAINPREGGVSLGVQNIAMPQQDADFQIEAAVGVTGRRFDGTIFGAGLITIDAISYHIEPRPTGVMAGAIS